MRPSSSLIRIRRRVFATTFSIVVVSALLPNRVAAQNTQNFFVWVKGDGGGDWAQQNNWFCTRPEAPACTRPYPNHAEEDVVQFTSGHGDQPTKVRMPNSAIKVARLRFANLRGAHVTLESTGTASLLAVGSSRHTALIEFDTIVPNSAVLNVPIELAGDVMVVGTSVGMERQQFLFLDPIRGPGKLTIARRFTPSSTGGPLVTMDLEGDETSSYAGGTHVSGGELRLGVRGRPTPNGQSIPGPLVIGSDGTSAGPARVVVEGRSQIADTAAVSVFRDGHFAMSSDDAIGTLILNNGTDQVRELAAVSFGSLLVNTLLMQQSSLTLSAASLVMNGNITARGTNLIQHGQDGLAFLTLLQGGSTMTVLHMPQFLGVLTIADVAVGNDQSGELVKDGPGTLRFTLGGVNAHRGGTWVKEGAVESTRGGVVLPHRLVIGGGGNPATVITTAVNMIAQQAPVTIRPNGTLSVFQCQLDVVTVLGGGTVSVGSPPAAGQGTIGSLTLDGGRVVLQTPASALIVGQTLRAGSDAQGPAVITATTNATNAVLRLSSPNDPSMVIDRGPQPVDVRIEVPIAVDRNGFVKRGTGILQLAAFEPFARSMTIEAGTVLVTGAQSASPINLLGGVLGGTGDIGTLTATAGTVAPGTSAGRLTAASGMTLAAAVTFAVELNGLTPGVTYDQIAVDGGVSLGGAALSVTRGLAPPADSKFTIVANDGTDAVSGTFAGLPEGASATFGGRTFTISYVGGDGNDVVLTAGPSTPNEPPPPPDAITYYLAEGATGSFFDDDVLIANTTMTAAPVTMTFLKEGGGTVVEQRTIPAQSRVTVHVDRIPGLEGTSASVRIVSDDRVPLVVERTMFWDAEAGNYGGHTANAVARPEMKWIFAEGFQGFFDTYILIANANAAPTTATITFLRENDTPVVKTVAVEALTRKTVFAGDYAELHDKAFGIVVEATAPVIAERAMYFASQPGKLWTGGHGNIGMTTPATSWFHAEGATGGFFTTFILLSNPQTMDAHVRIAFLLEDGTVVTRDKTIGGQQRATINPAVEGDARLTGGSLSTIVESDVPIVSERSMYWAEGGVLFGEGHNSSGLTSIGTRWGLAEGRLGGPQNYATYILLANPDAQRTAEVTVTFLREGGAAPLVKTYTVKPTSRFNVDVSQIPELRDASFGARIDVTNGVDIAVERSLYWDVAGVLWAGGTNATGIRLP